MHGTTILSVRRGATSRSAATARSRWATSSSRAARAKVRRLYQDRILAGFAGGTADAFTLFERFEAKLEKHQGNLMRSAVELAKDWRTDRMLRRLEAMLAVADRRASLIITGTGDVLEPEHGIVAIGSGGPYAQAAARALARATPLSTPKEIVDKALADRRRPVHLHQPASDRHSRSIWHRLAREPRRDDAAGDRPRARQVHRRAGQGQARGRDRAAQPLAAPAGRRAAAPARSRRRTSS